MAQSHLVRSALAALALGAGLTVAACSQPAPEAEAPPPAAAPAAPAAEAPAATTEAAPSAEAVTVEVAGLTGNSEAGAKVFRQCAACHVVEPGVNRVGPSLHGIVGRTAGTVEGFKYSDANKNSGITWTEQELFTYLENPRQRIPGTIMAFAGLKNPQDRADVIAYLRANSPS